MGSRGNPEFPIITCTVDVPFDIVIENLYIWLNNSYMSINYRHHPDELEELIIGVQFDEERVADRNFISIQIILKRQITITAKFIDEVDEVISHVEKADSSLNNIAWKLDSFEKLVTDAKPEEESMQRLLEGVSQIKQDYEKLRQDLIEVHELQRHVQDSVRMKAYQVQARYRELRMKLISQNFTE